MIPSIKTLTQLFDPRHHEDPRKQAIKLRRLLDGRDEPEEVSPACAAWVRQCYHRPSRHERVMCAADELMETHGVEAIFRPDSETEPHLSYCNMGDPYLLTLVYLHETGRYVVASYGDEVERAERRGVAFE